MTEHARILHDFIRGKRHYSTLAALGYHVSFPNGFLCLYSPHTALEELPISLEEVARGFFVWRKLSQLELRRWAAVLEALDCITLPESPEAQVDAIRNILWDCAFGNSISPQDLIQIEKLINAEA